VSLNVTKAAIKENYCDPKSHQIHHLAQYFFSSSVLNYYGIFYLGLSEVSSLFLVFIDLSKYFPPIPGTLYDHFIGIVCGPMFVAAFTFYRVILWWPVSYQLFTDVYSVVTSGQAQKLRPGCSWVLYVFLGCNLPLGLLQLYWFTIILGEVCKVLGLSW
jgi:hypothetical protein